MREWTEQEEQEMIDRAKAGEPEANYALSLWALARGEEEPDEPRWNRLAAKCLVKAAQAGYGPAQERMAGLLSNSGGGAAGGGPRSSRRTEDRPRPAEAPAPEDEPLPEDIPDEEPVQPRRARRAAPDREPVSIHDARRSAASRAPVRHTSTARRPEPPAEDEDELYDGEDGDVEDEAGVRPARGRKDRGGKGGLFSNWGETQWRRTERICVVICLVLLIAIAVMLFTSRGSRSGSEAASAIPPAGEVSPAAVIPTGEPQGSYPDDATRAEIEAAELDIPPMAEDYRSGPTTATVSVNSISLRLRKGPNTSYDEITSMPDGSKVEVFADKNDWSLVRYQGDEGAIYGWCSSTYLIIDATPAEITTPTPEAAG